MKSTKKLAMAALLALGLLALFAGPASAMKYSLNIAHPEGLSTGTISANGGMATDSAGNLYYLNVNNGKIEKFNSSGKYLSSTQNIYFGEAYRDLDVDSAGNIWVLAPRRLNEYSPTGTLLKSIELVEEAFAVGTAPSGLIYAAEWGMSWGYNTSGTPVAALGTGGPLAPATSDLDFDSSGRAWSGYLPGNTIRYFDATGKLVNSWSVSSLGGLAGDNNGNVWAAEPGSNRVRKYNASGAVVETFGSWGTNPGQFDHIPVSKPGIAAGPGGVVWVSNGDEIQKWVP